MNLVHKLSTRWAGLVELRAWPEFRTRSPYAGCELAIEHRVWRSLIGYIELRCAGLAHSVDLSGDCWRQRGARHQRRAGNPEASSLCTSIELGELGSHAAHSVGWADASLELGMSIELAALVLGVGLA